LEERVVLAYAASKQASGRAGGERRCRGGRHQTSPRSATIGHASSTSIKGFLGTRERLLVKEISKGVCAVEALRHKELDGAKDHQWHRQLGSAASCALLCQRRGERHAEHALGLDLA